MANQSFAYAMGRIRAVERKMLARAQFDRMIDARTADDAVRILRESEYGYSGGEGDDADNYEQLLEEENRKLVDFIVEISPEPLLLLIFLRRTDYHNAKVLLKAEFAGRTEDLPLSEAGLIPPQKLAQTIRERHLNDLPRQMAEGVESAIAAYNRTQDPAIIDIRLDQAAYAQMLAEAEELGNEFLTELVRIYIDLANINLFVRARAMKKPVDFLRGVLISGGRMDHGLFERYFSDSTSEAFLAAVAYSPYGTLCEEGIKAHQQSGQWTVLERRSDDYVNRYIGAAKLLPMGVELLTAYLVARQAELKNVRIVMVGKKNGVPGEIIRERLRETYV